MGPSITNKIRDYYTITGTLGVPTTDVEKNAFEQYLSKGEIDTRVEMRTSELNKLIMELTNDQAIAARTFYIKYANELGINIIEDENDINIELPNINIQLDRENTDKKEVKAEITNTLQVELNTYKESLTDEDDWGYDPSLIDTLEMEPVGFDIANMIYNLHLKLALLIRGVPGTGKTTTARNIADNITCKENQLFIQISPEYTYVDCIGGIKAVKGGWEDVRGVVYEFCKRAYKSWVISKKGNLDIEKFVIIIDEISKGNIEAIIGELSSAMEMRGVMVTTKDNKPFIVAPNVYIIATTNTSDMDGNNVRLSTSMMQRFFVYDILPQWTSDYIKILCKDVKDIKITGKLIEVAKLMTDVNNVIQNDYLLGIDKVIGTRMLLKEALTNTGLICNILPSINTQIDIIIKASGDSTKSKLIKLKDNIKNVLTSGDEV